MIIRLKYISNKDTRVRAIKKIDGTLPKKGDKLDIKTGDIFQILKKEGESMIAAYQGYFIPIEKEDLKKEEILSKIETFQSKLKIHQKYSCTKNPKYRTNGLVDELGKIFGSLDKYIDKLGNRKQELTIFNKTTKLDIYETSVGVCQNQYIFCPTIEKCIGDLNIIIGKIESLGGEDFNELFKTIKSESLGVNAGGNIYINSSHMENKNNGGVQNNNQSGKQEVEKQKITIKDTEGKESWQDNIILYIIVLLIITIGGYLITKYL